MSLVAYHLQARGAFHLGERGVGVEATSVFAHADTLFSALCITLREVCGGQRLEEFLATYRESGAPALVLSSAFPYAPLAEGGALRLYPRPLEWPPGVPDEPGQRKGVKRVAWVSESLFRRWVRGEPLADAWNGGQNLAAGGSAWLTGAERLAAPHPLWKVDDAPRVTVDRITNASAVYQAGRVRYAPGGGLWFLARWAEGWQGDGELALRALGDAGLGGERAVGHGQYDLNGPCSLEPLPPPVGGGRLVTLSTCYPRPSELPAIVGATEAEGRGVAYRLIARRGWMSSPDSAQWRGEVVSGGGLRRKTVVMFAEGSLLRAPTGAETLGRLARVTPIPYEDAQPKPHDVYRYGLALAVGCAEPAKGAGDG